MAPRVLLLAPVVVGVAGFLLLSMGGGIVAALTAAEVGWAAVYLAADEASPWIWLVPTVVGAAALALYLRRPERPSAVARA